VDWSHPQCNRPYHHVLAIFLNFDWPGSLVEKICYPSPNHPISCWACDFVAIPLRLWVSLVLGIKTDETMVLATNYHLFVLYLVLPVLSEEISRTKKRPCRNNLNLLRSDGQAFLSSSGSRTMTSIREINPIGCPRSDVI